MENTDSGLSRVSRLGMGIDLATSEGEKRGYYLAFSLLGLASGFDSAAQRREHVSLGGVTV